MKYFTHLIVLALLIAAPVGSKAQTRAEEPPPTRYVSACYLFFNDIPELYYQDWDQEYKPFIIESQRFTTWNKVPISAQLILYRKQFQKAKSPDEEPIEIMVPVTRFTLPETDEAVRILFYLDQNGNSKQTVLTDPRESHLSLTIRMINLTEETVLASIQDTTVSLPPQDEHIFSTAGSPNVRFTFQFGRRKNNGDVYVSPVMPLRFRRPDHRMTMIFGYRPYYQEDGGRQGRLLGYKIGSMRFYEQTPEIIPHL